MKSILFNTVAIIIAVSVLSSCSSNPIACFEVDNTNPEVGDTINFSNCSTDAESYLWSFGDGSTSNKKSPSYTYQIDGNFLVSLVVTGRNEEKTSMETRTIIVDEATEKTGKVVFWTQGNPPWDNTQIYIEIADESGLNNWMDVLSGTLTMEPECHDFNTATFTLPVDGIYGASYYNTDTGYSDGTVFTVTEGECLKIQID